MAEGGSGGGGYPSQNALIEGRHHHHDSKFHRLQETVDTFMKHTTQFPGFLTTVHSVGPFPARPQPGELPQGHKVSKPWPPGGQQRSASRGREAAHGRDAIPALPPPASALLRGDQGAGQRAPGHHAPPALMCWRWPRECR